MKTKPTKLNNLYLPAIECKMGNWTYYVTKMDLGDVAERIKFAVELKHPERYDEWIQREIQPKREEQIANYLNNQPERFFSSLVVTVYGGNPKWLDLNLIDTEELAIDDIPPLSLKNIDESLGLLFLSGEEDLFPIDGQHRLAGIRQALTINPELKNDVVTIIFVSDRGRIETRRLFSTLNRYAVPVNQGERIILDEDDALAITTRRLINEHSLLKNRVAPPKRLSLSDSDQSSFTTALTLYKINIILCSNYFKGKDWNKSELTGSIRPDDLILDLLYEIASSFWTLMGNKFSEIKQLKKRSDTAIVENRRHDGGHLLFRPVGQMGFARAIKAFHKKKVYMEEAFDQLINLPFELSKKPWKDVAWKPFPDLNQGRMIPTVEAQNLIAGLLQYYGGYDFSEKEHSKLILSYQKAVSDSETSTPTLPKLKFKK